MLKEIEFEPITVELTMHEALEMNDLIRKSKPKTAKTTNRSNSVECPTCGGEMMFSFTTRQHCYCIHCGQWMRKPEPKNAAFHLPDKSEFPYEDEPTGDKE